MSHPEDFPAVTRIGQSDLARALGLSQATVSLALRGHPRISEETRQRVLAEAERLGYRMDPLASVLADYRHRRSAPGEHGNIAVLSSNPLFRPQPGLTPPSGAFPVRHLEEMIDVAARLHGYNIEICNVGCTAKAQQAACRALQARGVIGLMITVGEIPPGEWAFDWEPFSVVDIAGIGVPRLFPTVGTHHFEATLRVVEELAARGYRKPGVWLDEWFDNVPAWRPIRAAFTLRAHELFGDAAEQTRSDQDLVGWLRKHHCDSLVTFGNASQLALLRREGWRLPEDFGLVGIDVDPDGEVSGISQDFTGVGRNAVALLDGLIRQGVRGIKERPLEMLVPASWHEGITLRPCLDMDTKKPRRIPAGLEGRDA